MVLNGIGQGIQVQPPKLLDQVRSAIRVRHNSTRTEEAYVRWTRRFVRFHGTQHPSALGTPEIEAFLTHLATEEHVAASTQNQALNALVFLYRHLLDLPFPDLDEVVRAKKPKRLPVVLTRQEAARVLGCISNGSSSCIRRILRRGSVPCIFPPRWRVNIRPPPLDGHGSTYFRPAFVHRTPARAR
jgi:integrase